MRGELLPGDVDHVQSRQRRVDRQANSRAQLCEEDLEHVCEGWGVGWGVRVGRGVWPRCECGVCEGSGEAKGGRGLGALVRTAVESSGRERCPIRHTYQRQLNLGRRKLPLLILLHREHRLAKGDRLADSHACGAHLFEPLAGGLLTDDLREQHDALDTQVLPLLDHHTVGDRPEHGDGTERDVKVGMTLLGERQLCGGEA